jgi:hypothetical protein
MPSGMTWFVRPGFESHPESLTSIIATSERIHPGSNSPLLAEDPRIRATGTSDPYRPLMPCAFMSAVVNNLLIRCHAQEHRHSFVRKNAVFAVYSIYQDHESLIPDAPELLDAFLAAESDSTCKRNAFVTLCSISQPTAVRYLLSNFDQIAGMDELMQMAVIELVRKEAKTEGGHRVSSFSDWNSFH